MRDQAAIAPGMSNNEQRGNSAHPRPTVKRVVTVLAVLVHSPSLWRDSLLFHACFSLGRRRIINVVHTFFHQRGEAHQRCAHLSPMDGGRTALCAPLCTNHGERAALCASSVPTSIYASLVHPRRYTLGYTLPVHTRHIHLSRHLTVCTYGSSGKGSSGRRGGLPGPQKEDYFSHY